MVIIVCVNIVVIRVIGVKYENYEIYENYKIYESIVLGGWMDGWVDGWMDGRKSRSKDCLQQSKSRK